ncbi:MAG TPA: DNA alkylation repair protein [Anaerolineales bacterium]|nr:DNA alkylation repair protein [Anaerolineales bacterium]
MPAIQLARLKKQVSELADLYHDPVAFRRLLTDILDFYADRTHRFGYAGEPPPILPTHNVPAPVMRQIIKELSTHASMDAESSLNLIDYLWKQSYLEENLLAAYLLGFIEPGNSEQIIKRVNTWLETKPEEILLNTILENSLANLLKSAPEMVIQAIEEWLAAPDQYYQHVGLKAIQPLIDQNKFDDLTVIFKLITPYIRSSSIVIQPDVIDVLISLARRTPSETAYTLRRILEASDNNNAAWYVRQTIKHFPNDIQSKLRDLLHENRKRKQ